MQLIHNKSFDELSLEVHKKLSEEGFSITPGSIAKLFSDIIIKYLSEFYDDLTDIHLQSFLSTSSGSYTDLIGKLVNCERYSQEESDSSYKERISQQVESLSRANELSIRLEALKCSGVEDVVLKKYSHGPGSFTLIPLSHIYSKNLEDEVYQRVHQVCSLGERVIVKNADFREIKLDINLVLAQSLDERQQQSIKVSVVTAIDKYINNIRVGDTLIINQLTNAILSSSPEIINYTINSFRINNKDCLIINQSSRWDEKFIIANDVDSIVIR